jgi:protein-tyrosine phosphatase
MSGAGFPFFGLRFQADSRKLAAADADIDRSRFVLPSGRLHGMIAAPESAPHGKRADLGELGMKPWQNWTLGLAVLLGILVPPIVQYRCLYDHQKRLREVTPGKFYRAGQLTAEGMTETVHRLGIRTIINVQDEVPDPALEQSFWDRHDVSEKALCQQLGVRYIWLQPFTRPDHNTEEFPESVKELLKVLDDPTAYPVLMHCRAGLHRTGVLTAVYRMEYEGWSHAAACAELKGNGFNVYLFRNECTCANDYVKQFVLNYRPRRASQHAAAE